MPSSSSASASPGWQPKIAGPGPDRRRRSACSSCGSSRNRWTPKWCDAWATGMRPPRGRSRRGSGRSRWLASNARMTRPSAERLVASARLVHGHPATAAAGASGDLSVPQVDALARAAHERADLYAEHEAALLDAARTVEVQDFWKLARRWRELADDERSARDAAFAFERRGFTLSCTLGGSVVA